MTMPAGLRVPSRREVENVREAFSRQPVRAIIIDAAIPGGGSIEDLTESIKQLFAIICSLRGPTRIPGVSLIASHNKADVIIPMQKVAKPLYGRLLSSLDQIPVMQCVEGVKETNTPLEQALVFAINDFRKFKELSGFHDQLEISVFSYRNSQFLRSFASATIHNLNSDEVKGIEFVSMVRCNEGLLPQSTFDQDLSCQNISESAEQSEFACLWNIVQIRLNAVSIQWHMRHWLKDESSDKEHLCLSVNDMHIKCDMQQRCISPNAFSFRHFYAFGEHGLTINAGNRTVSKQEPVPILHMQAKAMIDQDGICDSLVFGTPVVLVSSSCWRMEWEELDCNQDRFFALCKTMLDQRRCLLCEDITQHQSRHRNHSSNNQLPQPRGLFILLPSNSSSMLVKSIVPRELLLPTGTDSLSEKTNFSAAAGDVKSAIDSLENLNVYNPLNHPCGLYDSLNAVLLPKSMAKFPKSTW